MIIQEVLKGISRINESDVDCIFESGILCNWWRKVGRISPAEISIRLTERNLQWHQNRYEDPDPYEGNEEFKKHTPFISTTAGSVLRDGFKNVNHLQPAWWEALRFATDFWQADGWIFYCSAWVLGTKVLGHQAFAEEIRELHVYTKFSPFQPEGEITAKIHIPMAQIQRAEEWKLSDVQAALASGNIPLPARTLVNPRFIEPDIYSNVRSALV